MAGASRQITDLGDLPGGRNLSVPDDLTTPAKWSGTALLQVVIGLLLAPLGVAALGLFRRGLH
jgi:hypothetical protein